MFVESRRMNEKQAVAAASKPSRPEGAATAALARLSMGADAEGMTDAEIEQGHDHLADTIDAFRERTLTSVTVDYFQGPTSMRQSVAEVENVLGRFREASLAMATGRLAARSEARASDASPPTARPRSEKSVAVERANELNEDFRWGEARDLLTPYAETADVGARCALAASCLHLAEAAIERKDGATAAKLALEAVAHAEAGKAADPTKGLPHVWYGQAVQTKAKACEGQLDQARVCSVSVKSWEKASELEPNDPLPLHLLGSFAFVVSGLPWATARILRSLSPGLKKYSVADARALLLKSEELMPLPPAQYSVTNCSMIGRAYVQTGDKKKGAEYLALAVDEARVPDARLDHTAKEARAAAAKALKSL